MMMSKPAPAKSEESSSAAKKPAAAAAAASSAKKSPQDAVADLERRLAELTTHMPAPAPAPAAKEEAPPAAAAAAPPSSTAATSAATARGGKNALLVRSALEEAFGRRNDPADRLSFGSFSSLRFVPSKRPSGHVLSSILPLVYVCSVPNALK
jgi:hypothetical protein